MGFSFLKHKQKQSLNFYFYTIPKGFEYIIIKSPPQRHKDHRGNH